MNYWGMFLLGASCAMGLAPFFTNGTHTVGWLLAQVVVGITGLMLAIGGTHAQR